MMRVLLFFLFVFKSLIVVLQIHSKIGKEKKKSKKKKNQKKIKKKSKKNQKKNQKIKKSNPNAQIIAIGPVEISTSKYSSDPFNGRDPSKTYLW